MLSSERNHSSTIQNMLGTPSIITTLCAQVYMRSKCMQAKDALEKRKVELEAERSTTEKLQRKFAAIHSTLSSSKTPPSPAANA